MMEQINIGQNVYQFIRNVQRDADLRVSFNHLTQVSFGFSLEDWYLSGNWNDQHIPYSLTHGGEVVSNVSISIISFEIAGAEKKGVQIGTVMTAENYRNRGLNKYLLRRVLQEWKDQSDFIYLFANDTVLDFYPKFGFERVQEFLHTKS